MRGGLFSRKFICFVLPVAISVLVISLIAFFYLIPSYGLMSSNVNPRIIADMPVPLGLIHEELELINEGELEFKHGSVVKEDILTGDEPACVFVGKTEIDRGLLYVKIIGAYESKLNVLLVPKEFEVYEDILRPYGEGYYPLIHGPAEYIFAIMAEQSNGLYTEVFKRSFIAEFHVDEPYKYSNVFSLYELDSDLAKKAYEITHRLNSSEDKAKRIKSYIRRNFSYSIEMEVGHELVDNDYLYEAEEGVCYHYASMFSSMMKSVGIPVREVRGFLITNYDSKYHSWNEYLNEDGEWIFIDAMSMRQVLGRDYYRTEFSER